MMIINVDRRGLPVEIGPGMRPRAAFEGIADQGRLDFKVVLCHREAGEVVAYRGSGSDEWVMNHGDKLTLAAAETHFPGLAEALKRDGLRYEE